MEDVGGREVGGVGVTVSPVPGSLSSRAAQWGRTGHTSVGGRGLVGVNVGCGDPVQSRTTEIIVDVVFGVDLLPPKARKNKRGLYIE